MKIVRTIKEMHALSRTFRSGGRKTGFVPTMGSLHEGHLRLVKQSEYENDVTVASIFVNPAQFGPGEDFQMYPRDLEGDLEKLSSMNVDAVFTPRTDDMYSRDVSVFIDVGRIGQTLCGVSRPGHFSGVATVVAKLFNIVMPDRAYFGQKDFQQTVVIKKLVKELNFDIDIVVCPTEREKDGLAMSSRNSYLSTEEREAAPVLHRALMLAEGLVLSGKYSIADDIRREMEKLIRTEPLAEIDYMDIVEIENLEPMQNITIPAAVCIAVKIGNTRLIDNIIIRSHKP